MKILLILILALRFLKTTHGSKNKTVDFPSTFIFATATSAYQIEGGWNEDGKSPSVWDSFTHNRPDKIFNHSNGDVSVDSYHLYKKDIEALKSVGVSTTNFI